GGDHDAIGLLLGHELEGAPEAAGRRGARVVVLLDARGEHVHRIRRGEGIAPYEPVAEPGRERCKAHGEPERAQPCGHDGGQGSERREGESASQNGRTENHVLPIPVERDEGGEVQLADELPGKRSQGEAPADARDAPAVGRARVSSRGVVHRPQAAQPFVPAAEAFAAARPRSASSRSGSPSPSCQSARSYASTAAAKARQRWRRLASSRRSGAESRKRWRREYSSITSRAPVASFPSARRPARAGYGGRKSGSRRRADSKARTASGDRPSSSSARPSRYGYAAARGEWAVRSRARVRASSARPRRHSAPMRLDWAG